MIFWRWTRCVFREPGGALLDLVVHRARLAASLGEASLASARRGAALVAYGYIWPLDPSRWFVGGLAIHPDHRNASVTAELFGKLARSVEQSGADELHSHVLSDNVSSLRLHRRLGFREIRRSEQAVAFAAKVTDLAALAVVRDLRNR